jgi:hypothetical protein
MAIYSNSRYSGYRLLNTLQIRLSWRSGGTFPGPMERLHSKGYISDPKSKAKSVVLSEEGEKRSKQLFVKHFALKPRSHEQ